MALRAGVTGGVMGTVALTTAAGSYAAGADQQAHTVEMPALSGDLANGATQAADSMEATAQQYELQAAQKKAFEAAQEQARETKQKAEAKARAEAERRAEAARAKEEAAKERASRTAERGPLQAVTDKVGGGNTSTLVSFLKAQVGKAYVSGASGPSAYDCSGLTQAAFKQIGVDLPRVSQEQSTAGTEVSLDNLQEGDLLYWGGKGSAYHIAVYVGDGKYIGAQNPESGVEEQSLDYDPPAGAVRVL